MKTILYSAMLAMVTMTVPTSSFATDGKVKLSKAERKALDAKQNKLGKMSSMCIGALAMSTLDDENVRDTDAYKASSEFWVGQLDASLTHLKEKKQAKRRDFHRKAGSAALKRFGNGNIIAGGKQAKFICDQIQAEGIEGPTAQTVM